MGMWIGKTLREEIGSGFDKSNTIYMYEFLKE